MPGYTDLSQGTPFWVDLGSPDFEASKSFYVQLFGWAYEEAPPEDAGGRTYAWAENATGYAAGVYAHEMSGNEPADRSRWDVQLLVEDMAEIVRKTEALGGSVVAEPSKVGEYGIGATIAEPTGCPIIVWQPFTTGPTIKHEHGSMQWCELMSTDADATSSFFQELLGVKLDRMEMPDGSTNSIVVTADGPVMSISSLDGLSDDLVARAGGSMWVVYFNVDDVDAAVQRAVANGGELPDPPWDVPGVGRMAWIYDPQGGLAGLITPPGD